jgi:anthraniloyl-CoA monooxygenase
MRIVILGGGPAGLYAGLLIKKANSSHDILLLERNPRDVTYGWGVVFSDRTLASFQRADYKSYERIASQFVIWDAIDTHYRGELISCGGHVISSISRKGLLSILQERCLELGVEMRFGQEISDLAQLPPHDLLIAADGINSLARKAYSEYFKPTISLGKAKYIWLGAEKVLDAFTFIFCENEHGLFQVHAYPFSGTTSTFIVECDEASWLNAGLDQADEAASLAYCQKLLERYLAGARLLSNNSRWMSFPTLKTQHLQYQNIVLLGDATHTAHFSIGSGTKLAMEDAIALANVLEQHTNLETALNDYELERKPVVETFQRAAAESQSYFEQLKRYLGLPPAQFSFNLLSRSGRVTYDDLRLRDGRFGELIDRRFWQDTAASEIAAAGLQPDSRRPLKWPLGAAPGDSFAEGDAGRRPVAANKFAEGRTGLKARRGEFIRQTEDALKIAPPPLFAPFSIRKQVLANRLVHAPRSLLPAQDGLPAEAHQVAFSKESYTGAGLLLMPPIAISADGRITPDCLGMYTPEHASGWAKIIRELHHHSSARIALQLNHAGRRGATKPCAQGVDHPLREGAWPLMSASPLPYTPQSQTPKEMTRADMDAVREAFVNAAKMVREAGCDLLQINMAQGYLLASFLSPLSNQRADEYGGALENRLRFPLEVFDAVRAGWQENFPLSVALIASDFAPGGITIEDAVIIARALKEHGCDLIEVRAGWTIPDAEIPYRRGFLTQLSVQLRNEAGIPTMVGGYLTTTDEVNTILAGGRADLCIMEQW